MAWQTGSEWIGFFLPPLASLRYRHWPPPSGLELEAGGSPMLGNELLCVGECVKQIEALHEIGLFSVSCLLNLWKIMYQNLAIT